MDRIEEIRNINDLKKYVERGWRKIENMERIYKIALPRDTADDLTRAAKEQFRSWVLQIYQNLKGANAS